MASMTTGLRTPTGMGQLQQERKVQIQEKVTQQATEKGLLVVRLHDMPSGGGILTDRQKQWVSTVPYDSKTENPVLYRRQVEVSKTPSPVTEREEAAMEVQSLSDRPGVPLGVSGVADRIGEKRKERHDKLCADMQQELAVVNTVMEPCVREALELLKSQMAENDKAIASLVERMEEQQLRGHASLESLQSLWSELSGQSPIRHGYIKQLEDSLDQVEADRAKKITDILRGYTQLLTTVAHLLPDDVHRLMEEEAHTANLSLLANRRTSTNLGLQLVIAEYQRERELRKKWETSVTVWRQLVLEKTVNHFKLRCEDLVESPDLERLREWLGVEQGGVNRRREELLAQLAAMRPPQACKAAVYEWNENIMKLHKQLEHIHSRYLLQFQACQEEVGRAQEAEMEKSKTHLLATGAYDTSTVYEVMKQQFVPVVEQHSARAGQELHSMERSLDLLLSSQKVQFQALFLFAQGAAHHWDDHASAMARMEREFQESLEKCRSLHDVDNQNLEANLDVVLDRLRQGVTEDALRQFMAEALRLLETIRESYVSFHSTMVAGARKLPSLTQQEIDVYDKTLCKYFGVKRTPQKKRKLKSQDSTTASLAPTSADGRVESRASRKSKMRMSSSNPTRTGLPSSLSAIVEEVISTSQGTSFYVHAASSEDQGGSGTGTFLTQDEAIEGVTLSFATENVTITEEAFVKARNGLRASFLDHLEQWRAEMLERASQVVAGKEEEAHTELELRLHLHEPRPTRVEEDIHNVRAAELLAHRDRVTRHARGMVASLNEQKSAVQTLEGTLQRQHDRFSDEVASLDGVLMETSNTRGLLWLKAQAQEMLDKHLRSVDDVSAEHLAVSEGIVTSLATSNSNFRDALKLFSEGGNYCHEEVELFAKKMDKLTTKIANAQTYVSSEVESITEAQRVAAREAIAKFVAQFQLHFSDLTFREQVSKTLTSAQVKIKAEVAASNTQAKQLSTDIWRLETMVEVCRSPSPDKEPVNISDILERLPAVFQSLSDRVAYLHCRASVYQGARVGFHVEVSSPGLQGAKAQGPISAVNVTRSIMEYTSTRKCGPERDAGGTPKPPSRPGQSATGILGSGFSMDAKGSVASVEDTRSRSRRSSRRKPPIVERKNVNYGIGGGEEGSSCFLPRVRAILKDTHTQLYAMTESFYKQKGPRQVTRPNEMQETFEGCMDSLIERCQSYRHQAEDYRNDCIEEFRLQLDSLMSLLVSLSPLVLQRVRLGHQREAARVREELMQTHQKEMSQLAAEQSSHESSLRPALGHPGHSGQLEALCSQEEDCHQRAMTLIKEHTHHVKESECLHARTFFRELVETTRSLLSLFDDAIPTSEIIPGSSKLKVKPPVEQLLRDHLTIDTDTKGSETSVRATGSSSVAHGPKPGTWQGLPGTDVRLLCGPSYTLTVPPRPDRDTKPTSRTRKMAVTSRKQLPEKAMATEGTEDTSPPQFVEEMSSRKATVAHEAVIRSRDEAFQEYLSAYKCVLNVVEQREEEERELEEKWTAHWRSSVDRVKQLYTT